MKWILKILISAFAVFITAYLMPGVAVGTFAAAIVVAFVLALLNMFVKPLLVVLTIPVTIMSFGLFLLVINAFIILIAGELVKGFEVNGFGWALLFSIFLSFVTYLLELPVKPTRPHSGRNTESF